MVLRYERHSWYYKLYASRSWLYYKCCTLHYYALFTVLFERSFITSTRLSELPDDLRSAKRSALFEGVQLFVISIFLFFFRFQPKVIGVYEVCSLFTHVRLNTVHILNMYESGTKGNEGMLVDWCLGRVSGRQAHETIVLREPWSNRVCVGCKTNGARGR